MGLKNPWVTSSSHPSPLENGKGFAIVLTLCTIDYFGSLVSSLPRAPFLGIEAPLPKHHPQPLIIGSVLNLLILHRRYNVLIVVPWSGNWGLLDERSCRAVNNVHVLTCRFSQ